MVAREHREKHRVLGVWNSLGRRAFRRNAARLPEVQVKDPTVEEKEETASPEEPVVSTGEGVVAAVVAGAGMGIGVGLGHKPFQDAALDGHVARDFVEEHILPDKQHTGRGVIADAHSFTSSPRPIAAYLPPGSPTNENGNHGVRWDERSPEFQARMDRNYMRKRASVSSLPSCSRWIRTDDISSPSVHDDDPEYCVFHPSKAKGSRYGRIPGTN